jgi:hypothetical protein
MTVASQNWKILQIIPSTGWAARFRANANELVEMPLASWALVDDGTRTFMTGMVAVGEGGACAFAPQDARFAGYFYRGAEVPIAAELPAAMKAVKTGVAWRSASRTPE